jgi:hypothetical protein
VLLEARFDVVTPNTPKDISSWAYDYAATKIDIIDNRAKGVVCYDPGHTLVEKLQTISTKFRLQQEKKDSPLPIMRHYYDAYSPAAALGRAEIYRHGRVQGPQSKAVSRWRRTRSYQERDVPSE